MLSHFFLQKCFRTCIIHGHVTEGQDSSANQAGSSNSRDTSIAPAFAKLRVQEPKQKARKVVRLSAKLPKAISGSVAIKTLREREQKKKEDELAKIKRKEERMRKKEEKEAEKERKKLEREEKSAMKKKSKNKGKKRKYEMDSNSESDDQYDSSAYLDDVNSDNFEEKFEMCPSCNKGDQHPSRWITCEACLTRWHFICANRPEFDLLDEDERKKMQFICPLCE